LYPLNVSGQLGAEAPGGSPEGMQSRLMEHQQDEMMPVEQQYEQQQQELAYKKVKSLCCMNRAF